MAKLTTALLASNMREHAFTWLKLAARHSDEIVVLVHESTDGTLEFFQHALSVNAITHMEQLPLPALARDGFAAAKNRLMDLSTGDWVIFLDSDEAVHPADYQKLRGVLRQPDSVDVLTIERYNMVTPAKNELGANIPVHDWEQQWFFSTAQNYQVEPQHKVLRSGVKHAGIIHEEPGGIKQQVNVRFKHMCLDSKEDNHRKHQLYMWLIKQCVDHPEKRHGINPYWYGTFYSRKREYVDRLAKEFEDYDSRFPGRNNS